jgi:hypothetical protein
MMQILYISGPVCSGKTALRKYIERNFPVDMCVIGDEHWLKFPNHAFNERVGLANASIIDSLHKASGALIICEWVPVVGAFIDEIRKLCKTRGMQFSQIALYADESVLCKRKRIRDGDDDTSDVSDKSILSSLDADLVLDTGKHDVSSMCQVVTEWLANKTQQQEPFPGVANHWIQ